MGWCCLWLGGSAVYRRTVCSHTIELVRSMAWERGTSREIRFLDKTRLSDMTMMTGGAGRSARRAIPERHRQKIPVYGCMSDWASACCVEVAGDEAEIVSPATTCTSTSRFHGFISHYNDRSRDKNRRKSKSKGAVDMSSAWSPSVSYQVLPALTLMVSESPRRPKAARTTWL